MPRSPDSTSLPGSDNHIYQVSELNAQVRGILEKKYPLIWLQGEVSNFRHFQASGHWYFTLKDSAAQIAAAMFRGQNRRVAFTPTDGEQVLVLAQVSLYEPRGSFQIIARRMERQGDGALHAAFLALKERLAAEGLFAGERKKPLPRLPRRVAVITSRDGAALRDILRTLQRRHAGLSVLLLPTRVQGAGAAGELAAAVTHAGAMPDLDAIILGRGGGSLEDLWAFNDEGLARAIASCPVPVISAVGHESDFTISDLVADCRAATPTAAAMLVVASAEEIQERLRGLQQRLSAATRLTLLRLRGGPAGRYMLVAPRLLEQRQQRATQRSDEAASRLLAAAGRQVRSARDTCLLLTTRLSPRSLREGLASRRQRLGAAHSRLLAGGRRATERARQEVARTAGRLQDLSPLAVLGRGYALARRRDSGLVLRDAEQVKVGDRIQVTLHRGGLQAQVSDVLPHEKGD